MFARLTGMFTECEPNRWNTSTDCHFLCVVLQTVYIWIPSWVTGFLELEIHAIPEMHTCGRMPTNPSIQCCVATDNLVSRCESGRLDLAKGTSRRFWPLAHGGRSNRSSTVTITAACSTFKENDLDKCSQALALIVPSCNKPGNRLIESPTWGFDRTRTWGAFGSSHCKEVTSVLKFPNSKA